MRTTASAGMWPVVIYMSMLAVCERMSEWQALHLSCSIFNHLSNWSTERLNSAATTGGLCWQAQLRPGLPPTPRLQLHVHGLLARDCWCSAVSGESQHSRAPSLSWAPGAKAQAHLTQQIKPLQPVHSVLPNLEALVHRGIHRGYHFMRDVLICRQQMIKLSLDGRYGTGQPVPKP